jgi:uncharacterized protein YukE
MNKDRRKRLQNVIDALRNMVDELYAIQEEEQEAYDNLPESFQEGERGEKMSDAIDTLDMVLSEIDSQADELQEMIDN